jgi:hypothetical protein
MENIIEPNETFDFSKLSLALPTGIQGGAYFTKIYYLDKPLYIQTSKSLTKQGIVKTGKKYHCDLMFDNNAEILIRWLERLETKCQQLIFEKSDSWFQSTLDLNDIETAFNSPIRLYKSGKYYLVRTNIKNNNVTNIPIIKIYNENEDILSTEDVASDSNIISILEIQGIKFTNHNFQLEIELKQMMVINNEPIFENCLIKTNTKKMTTPEIQSLEKEIINELKENGKTDGDVEKNTDFKQDKTVNFLETESETKTIDNSLEENLDNLEENVVEKNEIYKNDLEDKINLQISENLDLNIGLDLEMEDLDELDSGSMLKEMEIVVPLENNSGTITLKKPNDVYYDIYKQARNKAKEAKKMAIIAYLEAKNIKKTYMLDDLDYSDNDIDNEIEEVSESQLDGL